MGSSFPCANAFARRYIWLEVAPAASIALATTSQLRISVDIFNVDEGPNNFGYPNDLVMTLKPAPKPNTQIERALVMSRVPASF